MESALALLYAIIALSIAAVYWIRRNFSYWTVRGVACEKPHLIYGSMRGFYKTRGFHEIFNTYYRQLKGTGPFCGFFFFQRPTAFILDTQLAKNILIKDFASFENRGVFHNERDDPLTGHLFALDGPKWKRLRQKLSPTFTSGKMKFMFPTVMAVAEQLVDALTDLMSEDSIVEIKEVMTRFTTDVIGTCAFGIECNSLRDPNSEFRVMGRSALERDRHGNLVMIFIQSFPRLSRKLRLRQIAEDIHQFFMRIVRETVDYRERNAIKRNDFMSLMIELKNSRGLLSEDGKASKALSVEEVAAQAFLFFLAGFETSSTAMSFTLYELAQREDIQRRVRDEINETLARHDNQLTYEGVKKMQYLDQVFSESLRMHTVVSHLVREAVKRYVVPDHPQFVIEKGMSVIIPVAAYHQDPDFYPDPQVFRPERFAPEEVAKRGPAEWLAFGDGPRNCIGLRFGKMQALIGLALLLRNFKFSVCAQTEIPPKCSPRTLTLTTLGGIYLNVTKV